MENDKAIYFLYHRKTGESVSEEAGPSAWGAAALMDAVEEGLAGIVDAGTGYDEIAFSPRWPVTPYRELRYVTGYEMSKKYVDVRHIQNDAGFRYHLRSPASKVKAHLLVPEGKSPMTLLVNGKETAFALSTVGKSMYVDAVVAPTCGVADFEVLY